MSRENTIGILLAAGVGRRFDESGARNKLSQLLADGLSVASRSARLQLDVLPRVVAVVRNEEIAEQLRHQGCHVLIFSEAEKGMGATLAYAVTFIERHFPEAHSALIGLADMPYILPSTIAGVVKQLEQGAEIVQPVYRQQPGHPVGFARCHFAALRALQGDTGARELLRNFPVVQLEVDDPGIIQDIDYQSDLLQSN